MNVVTSINEYFGKVPIAIWVIDEVSMRFLAVNNALLTMYGYSEEDFLAMTISDIVVSDSPSAGVAYFITDTGECSRHKRKNGTAFYVRILSQEVSFNDIPARLCYVLDIDNKVVEEQKNAELLLQLKYQKERIDNILLSVNDGIWSRRADNFDLIYGNSAYFQLYGLSPEGQNNGIEQLQKSVFPTDLEQVNSAIRQVLLTGEAEAEYRYLRSDGKIKTLRTKAFLKKSTDGNPDIINGITNDITLEKELFDAIRTSEHRLLATINNTKDLIWSVDTDLRITFCNKAYQDFFLKRSGIALDEGDYVLGQWHSESFITKRKSDYERALKGESFMTIVEENYDGIVMYNEISTNPVADHDGRIIGVNCIARDISRQRIQLINIRAQNEKLKQLARKKMHIVQKSLDVILGSMHQTNIAAEPGAQYGNVEVLPHNTREEIESIVREIVNVTMSIDASFPDTDEIISRL